MKSHPQFFFALFATVLSLNAFAQVTDNQSSVCSLTVTIVVTDASVPQAHDGTAVTTVANGKAPYSYQWNGGQTTANITNASTGYYCVTVVDDAGCYATACGKVSAPGCDGYGLTVNYTAIGPNQNRASASTTTGTSPYTYIWSTGDTTSALADLPSGIYCVTLTDAIGCSATGCVGETVMALEDDEAAGSIKIYPNPARDVLIIEPVEQENALLTISSLDGKVVLAQQLNTGTNAIGTQGLPNGMYIYTLSSATSPPTLPQKLLINH